MQRLCTRLPRSAAPRRTISTSSRCLQASTSTSSDVQPYPFSKVVATPPLPNEPRPPTMQTGKNLMQYLHKTLRSEQGNKFISMFGRRDSYRIRPGSVLTLVLEHPPYSFSGVLIAIRRKGVDTSILLRNIVQRTGVEMQFFLNSPSIKEIKIVQRAGGKAPPDEEGVKMGKAAARAKLYFLRDHPQKMSAISAGISKQSHSMGINKVKKVPTSARVCDVLLL